MFINNCCTDFMFREVMVCVTYSSSILSLIIKSLCMSQRLLVLQKILNFSSYYYYSSSRQNLVRTSPPTVLMIQICYFVHILI